MGKSRKYKSKGINFIQINETEPYKIGLAHGRLLKSEIKELVDNIKSYMSRFFSPLISKVFQITIIPGLSLFKFKFSKNHMQEMQGIAKASGQSLKWIVFVNMIYDLGTILNKTFHFMNCTTFMTRLIDSQELISAKTTDLIQDDYFSSFTCKLRTVFIYNGFEESSFITSSFPGVIAGDWCINTKGYFLGFNDGGMVDRFMGLKGVPATEFIRNCIEQSKSYKKLVNAVEKVRPLHPYIAVLTNGEKEDSYLFEIGQKDMIKNDFKRNIICTNFFPTESMRKKYYLPGYIKHRDYLGPWKRYIHLKTYVPKLKNLTQVFKLLKLHNPTFDTYEGSIANRATVQAVVFNSAQNKLYLPKGNKVPINYYGEWKEFELGELFQLE